jgi:excisionase family DNA binding protein
MSMPRPIGQPGHGYSVAGNYLHTAQVAEILGASPKTVSRWTKEGKLPFLNTLGGHRRYPEKEIREIAELLVYRPSDAEVRRLQT